MDKPDDWIAWAHGATVTVEADSSNNPLPPILRRRVTAIGQTAFRTACNLTVPRSARFVLCSRHGEFQRTLRILTALAGSEPVSPAEFSLSVHNALAGLLSIAWHNPAGHTTIAAGADSFGSALIEAASCLMERPDEPVLLVSLGALPKGARIFGTVTHQHVFGMTFRLIWPILAGRPFESEFHVAWEPLLERLSPRPVIVSSPAQLTRLGGMPPLPAEQRPLMVITAGAPLPESAAAEAMDVFGCAPTEIYGSTEAGVIGWRVGVTGPVLWRPFPDVEVGTGAEGVLLLRSRHASQNGWNEQADRIALMGDGLFRLDGRVDRIVKIEGKRVSLERVERALLALPWIQEAAVVSLGGDKLYLGVVAKLSPAGGDEIEQFGKFRFERKLRRELAQVEDPAVLPRRWRFVKEMPVDGLGKRRNADLQALFGKST